MAITSLVLGILSITLPLISFGFMSFPGLILGVLAIIFGNYGRAIPGMEKMATGGFICGIIGTVISLMMGFWWVFPFLLF